MVARLNPASTRHTATPINCPKQNAPMQYPKNETPIPAAASIMNLPRSPMNSRGF